MKNQTSQFISTPQLAKQLGISRVAIFKKIQKGEIAAVKNNRGYLIDPAQIPGTRQALTADSKKLIARATKKVIAEYGDTLKMLAKE